MEVGTLTDRAPQISYKRFCGWERDDEAVRGLAKEVGAIRTVASGLIGGTQRDVDIYSGLLQVKPTWQRGAQGIGDCVSWGLELPLTCLLAIQHLTGQSVFTAEVATEPLYGGMRVEAQGKSRGGWSDGSWGGAGAKWARDGGVILRVDHSSETGNAEHDLRKYDKDKAKQWGNFGCGGEHDKGKLDAIARARPVRHVVQVNDIEEISAALTNAYPVSIASSAGFGNMRRDENGICRRRGTWHHQMCILAIRWRNGRPEFLIVQSWGNSCSGPSPGIIGPMTKCAWWATEEDVAWILRTGDCWAYSDVSGFPPRELDFAKAMERM